jgi:choline dehydrogenase-like flavoprotein
MAASDFDALPTQSGGIEAWPVEYGEFEPFYEAAERLHGIDAGYRAQALPRLSEWNRELMAHMQARGMTPDVLHTALRYDDACQECVTHICPRRCKADALSVSLDRAASLPNFKLIEECDVQRLEADASRITGLIVSCGGKQVRISARMVVLAAGALHTPQLLLRSASEAWPDGVANRSGQVGRNLMFHTVDVLALWAPRKLRREGRQRKALSIRDFYVRDGVRLGYIQSMGLDAGRGMIAVYMKDALRRRGIRNELLLKLLVALPARIAAAVADSAEIFAAMSEDDPNPANRLTLEPGEPDGASIHYTITDDLRERATRLREEFARGIAPWRLVRTSMSLDMNYGHSCGTCRFGNDPATSVLDRDCRAHDIDNLYVVDASFMPRSGAVNPSLTIAANAIRVAAAISERLSRP